MKEKEAELLLVASLESEKNERERIAADLHDSVSSDLSAIRNYLVVIIKGEDNPEKANLFKELKDGVEEAIENTRLISYKLIPPLLETTGFIAALRDFFEQLSHRTTIAFVVDSQFDYLNLSKSSSYELFRIVQEFTTNMLKYGGVKKCTLLIYEQNGMLFLELLDDGMSFNFALSSSTSKGTGLKNINSRLKVIKATLAQREVTEGNHFVIKVSL